MFRDPMQASRAQLGVLLWAAGMLGVVAATLTLIPVVSAGLTLPLPLWAISLLSSAQSGVLLALAVWAGVALAPTIGFQAPTVSAILTRRPLFPVLGGQLAWGIMAGLLSGVLLHTAWSFAPQVLGEAYKSIRLPLVARVLYGGITEELLLRWGLMTVLAWLAWRVLQRGRDRPSDGGIWLALVVSALLFGAGHLPAAVALVGTLDASAVAWVVGVNSGFGLVFGYLFWRRGLEAAMIAHALAHIVHSVVERL